MSDKVDKAISIPANLIQKSPQGFYVYIIDTTSGAPVAKEVSVKIGKSFLKFMSILYMSKFLMYYSKKTKNINQKIL